MANPTIKQIRENSLEQAFAVLMKTKQWKGSLPVRYRIWTASAMLNTQTLTHKHTNTHAEWKNTFEQAHAGRNKREGCLSARWRR